MSGLSRRLFPLLPAGMMVFGLAACAGESQADAEGGEEAGEHAAMEGGGEGAESGGEAGGEHNEGGEASEGRESREGGGEHNEGGEGEGEHGGEGAHDEEGEESGVYIAKADTWDVERNGAQLVLSFDTESNSFVGTVENKTPVRLCAIRVEVHPDTGTELGPTDRVNLDPGATTSVTLAIGSEAFESFTAHPEMSPCG